MTEGETARHIDERLRNDPNNPELLIEAARYYHRLAMQGSELALDRADESVRALLHKDKRNAEAVAIRANTMILRLKASRSRLRRVYTLVRAGRMLDRAVAIDPANMTARTVRAFTALVFPSFLGRWKTAVVDFEYLIKRKAEDSCLLPDEMMPKVYYNLGLAYAKTKQLGQAVRVLTEVVERFPQAHEAERARDLIEKMRG
ncbi:MAG TPA: tetratricopeptide repeat protein [bacterium]|nr:tetratricopeptide repeat protein [bacterium]